GANYRLNAGGGWIDSSSNFHDSLVDYVPGPPFSPATDPNIGMQPNGVFYYASETKTFNIADGASNTAAISERLIGDFQNTIATHETDTFNPGTFPTSAGLPDGSLPGASADCGALDSSANWTNTTFQGFSDSGQAWLTGWHSITLYDHTMAPNTISCVFVSPA